MKLIILSLLLVLSSCSSVMTKHQKGLVLFKDSSKKLVVSEKVVNFEACNKIFLFLPYEINYFSNQEYFSKELEKHKGIGLADAQIQTTSYWKYLLGFGLCEEIQGKVVVEND